MGEFLLELRNLFGLAWWIEVRTAVPPCTYYFGPFGDRAAAEADSAGYIEDLEAEGARGITTTAKRCKPPTLTLVADEFEREQLDRLGAMARGHER